MEINTINLVGRAGREPDVRYILNLVVSQLISHLQLTEEAEMKNQTGLIQKYGVSKRKLPQTTLKKVL